MSLRIMPVWPFWQRINFLIFTIAGGSVGYYLQNKFERKHKLRLQAELPKLEADLASAISRRESLERQLRQLEAAQTTL